jgi:general secretion pathway protein K
VGADQPQQRGRRGVALILVLMVLAIMAAFTTEYHYKSYIRLHVASNLRDEVVAYYHARSAMEVARLVIKSQNVADNMLNAMAAFVPNIRNQNIELWTFACEFANAFCTGELKLMGKTFFNFEGMGGVGVEEGGACGCRAKPEDGAININRVDSIQDKNQLFSELYRELVRFREEPLTDVREIDEETAELVLNIIDWADPDTQRSDLVAGRLQDGIQGEGGNYALGVQAKDAKFDTLAELQLVEGMTRDLYCQISDKLTPYATRKLNVNTAQLSTLRAILCESAANQADTCYGTGAGQLPVMDYALYCMDMCRTLRQSLMSPGFGNIQSFLQFFSRLPWGPRPQFGNQLQQRIGVKSRVIRVETMGSSFGSNRGLTAVIDTSTGDYVYWREH